ncbi:DUF413 domain-containing protein [Psittacicella hinzii]|uniref:Macrodomain Ori protein n=1 Tax=Psittacicella hinzii TaxID=2028575 RepID=A0A3A1YMH6_9GAMM|nr:DUF413 domain-containing protein [Psittacicella hinzii]RIY37464.1 hypothetical protein CKF58_04910 [Psittacicella hinzii]
MQTQSGFIQEKKYFDDKNYPHGFSRSGDYTIKEAEALENYGSRLTRLANGTVEPENEVEKHFVAVVADQSIEDKTFIEKTWLKYQRLITEVKRVYILADGNSAIMDDGSNLD